MLWRKLGHGHADVFIEFFTQQHGVRSSTAWGIHSSVCLGVCYSLAPKIEREVHGDSVQPRIERRGHTEALDGSIGLGKYFLSQVQRILPIPYHTIEERIYLSLIGSHQILKGIFLSPLYPRYQVPFFQSSSVDLDVKLCTVFTLF